MAICAFGARLARSIAHGNPCQSAPLVAAGGYAFIKVQDGQRSLNAFSAAQGVTLAYNEAEMYCSGYARVIGGIGIAMAAHCRTGCALKLAVGLQFG